jgi:hypothetical protein
VKDAISFTTHVSGYDEFDVNSLPPRLLRDRMRGRADENKASVAITLAHFGTYTVGETGNAGTVQRVRQCRRIRPAGSSISSRHQRDWRWKRIK